MLTTLKDIFRPTWKRIIFTALVGPALTIVGTFVTGLTRHGPHFVEYIALPLTIPYVFIARLGLTGNFWWVALLVPAFVYWYVIFCLCAYLRSRLRREG